MKSWTVYKHISPSQKVYIGITSDIKRRWAANGYYYCLSDTVFSRALKKYGWENFAHVVIKEGLTKKEACAMEKELIAYYKAIGNSYNITDGGEGTCGLKRTKEHTQKILESRIKSNTVDYLVIDKDFNYTICNTESEAASFLGGVTRNIAHLLTQPIGYTFRKHYVWKHTKGTPVDIESIKSQIQKALTIRKQRMSDHTKAIHEKMVEGAKRERESLSVEEWERRYRSRKVSKGWHHSEETKRRMSEKAKGRDMSKAIEASRKVSHESPFKKAILQISIAGETINEYTSITKAAKEMGLQVSGICNCLSGRAHSAGGFKWVYKN